MQGQSIRGVFVLLAGFFRELKAQIVEVGQMIRTREFWIYVAVMLSLLLLAALGIRVATGFDPLTRGQLGMSFSCRTGEGQLATIIVGGFVFALACVFTLGEIIHWVEETRRARAPGRRGYKVNYWRPFLFLAGTLILGTGGYALMSSWCT